MTEQVLSETTQGDKQIDEDSIIPTISFEYDLSWYGGDYTKTFGSVEVHIPVSFIEGVGREIQDEDEVYHVAFERYTGFARHHLIHWSNEVNQAYGDEQSNQTLHEQEVSLASWRKDHYPTCGVCSSTHYVHLVEQ